MYRDGYAHIHVNGDSANPKLPPKETEIPNQKKPTTCSPAEYMAVLDYINNPGRGYMIPKIVAKNTGLSLNIVIVALDRAYANGEVTTWRLRKRRSLCNTLKKAAERSLFEMIDKGLGDHPEAKKKEQEVVQQTARQLRIAELEQQRRRWKPKRHAKSLIEALVEAPRNTHSCMGLRLKRPDGTYYEYGAELAEIIDADQVTVPLYGVLLRKEKGWTPEQAAERAMELGYIPASFNGNGVDMPRFIEAFARDYRAMISKDYSKRVYLPHEMESNAASYFGHYDHDEEMAEHIRIYGCPPEGREDDQQWLTYLRTIAGETLATAGEEQLRYAAYCMGMEPTHATLLSNEELTKEIEDYLELCDDDRTVQQAIDDAMAHGLGEFHPAPLAMRLKGRTNRRDFPPKLYPQHAYPEQREKAPAYDDIPF